ncbi:MAG: dihydrodipicolinate synthase family protein [Anaerolineae bacterium]|nr:dihydrodipicolinate synthase family protein [Anaerolineae bacterium]
MRSLRFRGVYCALVTPYSADGSVDLARLRDLIAWLIERGVHGLWVCGGTGEGLLLDEDERRAVAETAVDAARGRVKVIVHVGALSTRLAAALAAHAARIGADGIACLPPFYWHLNDDAIVAHYQNVAMAADNLPLFAYNIPRNTGIIITPALLSRLRREIPTIVGLKHSSYDLFDLHTMALEHGDALAIFCGHDELFLPALALGACGLVGATVNFIPQVYVRLWGAYQEGNWAEAARQQAMANRIVHAVLQGEVVAATKAALSLVGPDPGPPRPPLQPLSATQVDELRRALKGL